LKAARTIFDPMAEQQRLNRDQIAFRAEPENHEGYQREYLFSIICRGMKMDEKLFLITNHRSQITDPSSSLHEGLLTAII